MDISIVSKSLELVADCFYQCRHQEGMELFMKMVPVLGKIPSLGTFLNPLFDSLEEFNYLLAADIIHHDMIPHIQG